ncbi:alcohol dehydrogenase catalytic domain-containing protein [Streptomyces capillispiralis]|uniref:Alcohol dehydrogenase n=1 Tax=Streptomyces capillispiralis TaxID=68182 RepID=A0A561T8Q8_9ACTN|nr:alcohol dehydrogenase catalytic domain-containing protein [Streptomyces capillispiralis]TWF83501.1 alcohol dehydrogenase [Streptomyces capillispiralis]GHH91711.1 Zn-dependent alcohol dehydrogenase [Streptomyces capillispiralis]
MSDSAVTMVVTEPRGPLHPVVAETVPPPAGWVRVSVVASGVCNADIGTAVATGEDTVFPVTPGHEVAGVIAGTGDGVEGWMAGDRVAVGWFGGSCGHCAHCRTGDVVHCAERKIPGLSYPGGWAQSMTVPADALARIPDGLDLFDAAPFGCAGVTTFNAISKAGIRAGGRVAVFGIGGLGHLALQFAAALGYETVAVARGGDREQQARGLGAHHYIDSDAQPPGAALDELGGADLIVCTASSTAPVDELLTGLAVHGQLTLVGVDAGSVTVPAARLVMNGHTLTGHLTGSPRETEEAMAFAVTTGVRPMIERMPLEKADDAVTRLRAAAPRLRIVLDAGSA